MELSTEQELHLVDAVAELGAGRWTEIASKLQPSIPGVTAADVQQRYDSLRAIVKAPAAVPAPAPAPATASASSASSAAPNSQLNSAATPTTTAATTSAAAPTVVVAGAASAATAAGAHSDDEPLSKRAPAAAAAVAGDSDSKSTSKKTTKKQSKSSKSKSKGSRKSSKKGEASESDGDDGSGGEAESAKKPAAAAAAAGGDKKAGAEDDDEPCCICGDAESYDGDAILFCDSCNIPVHQSCYGVGKVPEGDWFCALCKWLKKNPTKKREDVSCAVCPTKGGAFKQSSDNKKWAHVVCALWFPETSFKDPAKMEGIEGLHEIEAVRRKLLCEICRDKRGACVQCVFGVCRYSMHPSCGRNTGLKMEPQEIPPPAGTDIPPELIKVYYCPTHADAKFDPMEWRAKLDAKRRRLGHGLAGEQDPKELAALARLKKEERKKERAASKHGDSDSDSDSAKKKKKAASASAAAAAEEEAERERERAARKKAKKEKERAAAAAASASPTKSSKDKSDRDKEREKDKDGLTSAEREEKRRQKQLRKAAKLVAAQNRDSGDAEDKSSAVRLSEAELKEAIIANERSVDSALIQAFDMETDKVIRANFLTALFVTSDLSFMVPFTYKFMEMGGWRKLLDLSLASMAKSEYDLLIATCNALIRMVEQCGPLFSNPKKHAMAPALYGVLRRWKDHPLPELRTRATLLDQRWTLVQAAATALAASGGVVPSAADGSLQSASSVAAAEAEAGKRQVTSSLKILKKRNRDDPEDDPTAGGDKKLKTDAKPAAAESSNPEVAARERKERRQQQLREEAEKKAEAERGSTPTAASGAAAAPAGARRIPRKSPWEQMQAEKATAAAAEASRQRDEAEARRIAAHNVSSTANFRPLPANAANATPAPLYTPSDSNSNSASRDAPPHPPHRPYRANDSFDSKWRDERDRRDERDVRDGRMMDDRDRRSPPRFRDRREEDEYYERRRRESGWTTTSTGSNLPPAAVAAAAGMMAGLSPLPPATATAAGGAGGLDVGALQSLLGTLSSVIPAGGGAPAPMSIPIAPTAVTEATVVRSRDPRNRTAEPEPEPQPPSQPLTQPLHGAGLYPLQPDIAAMAAAAAAAGAPIAGLMPGLPPHAMHPLAGAPFGLAPHPMGLPLINPLTGQAMMPGGAVGAMNEEEFRRRREIDDFEREREFRAREREDRDRELWEREQRERDRDRFDARSKSGGGGGGSSGAAPPPDGDPRKFWVGGTTTLTEAQIRTHFETYGPVESIEIMKERGTNEPRGFSFVIFSSDAGAGKLRAELTSGRSAAMIGEKRINVKMATWDPAGRR